MEQEKLAFVLEAGRFAPTAVQSYEMTLKSYFGSSVHMLSTETLQVTDYNKYHMAIWNETDRKQRREVVFPDDCHKAYELGKSIASA